VLSRAGYRCEWIEDGKRREKAAPQHRLFADRIMERRDGGDRFDPNNGMCLCGSHNQDHPRAREQNGCQRRRGCLGQPPPKVDGS